MSNRPCESCSIRGELDSEAGEEIVNGGMNCEAEAVLEDETADNESHDDDKK